MQPDAGMSRARRGQTFGRWLWDERTRRALSRPAFAALVRKAALDDGEPTCGCDEKTIRRYENHQSNPRGDYVRWIAAALETPVEYVVALLSSQPTEPSSQVLGPVEPANAEYLEGIRLTIQRVVGIAAIHGADEIAPVALRAFRSAQRKLLAGGHPEQLTRELQAATGELAEVAGWLLHDADQQESARYLNVEALYWLRLAGDRNTELLTISNMAWMALFRKEPGEALTLARSLLDSPLSNRQRTMFELRKSRALAQLGDSTGSIRTALAAQNELGANDTTWNWWADESEVLDHVAATHFEAGMGTHAVELLERQDYSFSIEHRNRRYNALAWRLGISVDVGAHSDAEFLIGRILPFVGEVRSGRTEGILRAAVRQLHGQEVPPTLRDSGRQLATLLESL